MELYRYIIDDFLIEYCINLRSTDFIVEAENIGRMKQGKREYLNNKLTRELMKKLELYLEKTVDIPRINVGKKQTVETLVNEEASLFANYLRNEKEKWTPRVTVI